jgi:YHS domain-containing protein
MIAIDPVCKMEVEVETAEWKSDYKGQTYYFCAPGCQRSFEKDPEKYLAEGGPHDHGHGHEHHSHHH